ncbi:MAG: hypothetical protein MK184_11460 [Acidimicrobiales bacterium]|nr:hypothetical protein [Acidimicrobiales bacterium]
MNITPRGYETTLTRKELLEARDKDAARLRAQWKTDKEREATMMDWETLYRRLVTRLEEIADEGEQQSTATHLRMIEYDKVARAHARTAADLPMGEDG